MKDEIKEIAQMDANVLKSLEDFMETYKMIDVDQIYSNGTEYVPIFRVKQWLEYNNITNLQEEIKSANESVTWWTNRYEAVVRNCDETVKKMMALGEENERLNNIINEAIEYLTSYESISTIQGLDNIEKNKQLDENTMNIMTSRYLDVHHKLLNILQGDKDE